MTLDDAGCCAPDCCQPAATTIERASGRAGDGRPPRDLQAGDAGKREAHEGEAVRATVRARYADAATRAAGGESACCGPVGGAAGGCCDSSVASKWDPITSDLYARGETEGMPAGALLASLGCGNPTALAELREGEVVLDLGSGGGIDVLLSARRVGPTGKAYGLDMTDEMLALARENQRRSGLANVEFLRGEIERIPLPTATADVVISNCVINLSADKEVAIAEAFRVLKPGGRFAVADVVLRGELPAEVRASVGLWTGCVAGALHEDEYRALLSAAGFDGISLEATRVYGADDVRALLAGAGLEDEGLVRTVEGKVVSAFVRARRPAS